MAVKKIPKQKNSDLQNINPEMECNTDSLEAWMLLSHKKIKELLKKFENTN
ncbi:MAG: hypothetical protein JXB17_13230 [Bacteroidales bacterium]|nr:hypothetical protein [Bacteroidales bacterium]